MYLLNNVVSVKKEFELMDKTELKQLCNLGYFFAFIATLAYMFAIPQLNMKKDDRIIISEQYELCMESQKAFSSKCFSYALNYVNKNERRG